MRGGGGKPFIHIAVGVLRNPGAGVLICQRPAHKSYPGEWEFPGGKVEPGESVQAALRRELREELGIEVRNARPLIRLRHLYPELAVELDTWLITAYGGEPRSTEHPTIAWVAPEELPRWPLLAADRPIIQALRLPAQYVLTPPAVSLAELHRMMPGLPKDALLRLRLPSLNDAEYAQFVRSVQSSGGRRLILDRDPDMVSALGAAGWHATAEVLKRLDRRPLDSRFWVAASCHDAAELERARAIGADFAVLGPVQATASHSGAATLGWSGFERMAVNAGLPVYAIGGLDPQALPQAWQHGAQGVAGISAFWGG